MGRLGLVRDYVLGESPSTKQERRLLLKIDWFILSYCCLMVIMLITSAISTLIKSVLYKLSNISNAYVSGMKEELNMHGTDFNKINTIFTCGYIVGMIPNNLMLQLISPRIWFPAMQVVWGCLTMSTSAVHNVQQIYAIRFFQGMAESSTFVGTHYVLGSWYKHAELGKRSAVFTSSGLAGTLFSGVLQAAVFKHLNGRDGRSGWRWLFIIDGIITLPIAVYGFFVFPNLPSSTKAFYLSDEERLLSVERLKSEVQIADERISWRTARRILSRWRWYACSLLFAVSGETESFGTNNIMGQWLKAEKKYTVEQIDYYPSGVTAFAIVSTLVCATWTDHTQVRWPVLIYMSVACIVSSICILIWKTPTGVKFFAYYLAGASYAGQATTFAWANQICSDDDHERAIVLASMNMFNNVVNAWWPLVFYPASDAPRFRKGMIAMIAISLATIAVTGLVWFLEHREKTISSRLDRSDNVEEKPRASNASVSNESVQ